MEETSKRGPLTVRGALWALAGAVILAFVFYYVVGFPANVPVAIGSAVLLAELVEMAVGSTGASSRGVGRTILHAFLAAAAGWLGVAIAQAFGRLL